MTLSLPGSFSGNAEIPPKGEKQGWLLAFDKNEVLIQYRTVLAFLSILRSHLLDGSDNHAPSGS
ncbi:MAG: hypothetical protein ACKO22_13580 [Cyanobium sp.]